MYKVFGLLLVAAACGEFPCRGFLCDDGTCISSRYVCDSWINCPSGDDEFNCTSCQPGFYQCAGNLSQCIVEHWVCDGYVDCLEEGDDETNCDMTDPPVCGPDQFQCGDGSCINEIFHCDVIEDCDDYTDDTNCSYCKEGFHCSEGTCIQQVEMCDEYEDCIHGEDEVTYCECLPTDWVCGNGHCIPQYWRCDGFNDCYGDDDEADCPTEAPVVGKAAHRKKRDHKTFIRDLRHILH